MGLFSLCDSSLADLCLCLIRNYVEAKSILRQETVQVEEDLWIGISDAIGWLLKVHRSDEFGNAFVNDVAPFLQVITL